MKLPCSSVMVFALEDLRSNEGMGIKVDWSITLPTTWIACALEVVVVSTRRNTMANSCFNKQNVLIAKLGINRDKIK